MIETDGALIVLALGALFFAVLWWLAEVRRVDLEFDVIRLQHQLGQVRDRAKKAQHPGDGYYAALADIVAITDDDTQ